MSRNKYVLYNNVTGNIESIETITEAKAIKLCTLNRGMNMSYILESDIDGSVHSSKLLQLELSTSSPMANEWVTYRQALRDFDYNSITEDYNIPWPTRPE